MPLAFFLGTVFLVGACVGSFLNVCIGRWPLELSVVAPRSRCPKCERQIRWYENFPIVSWLALRARCAGCGLPISAQYPLVELIVGLGWAAAFLTHGPTLVALNLAVFGTVLLGIAVTDAQHYLIPDGFTVFGLVWVLAMSAAMATLGETTPFAAPFPDALLGACAAAGAIRIIGWLAEVALKKEAMGFGDETLMAVVGAALGPARSVLTIFVAAALGAATFLLVVYPIAMARSRRRGEEFEPPMVPFGVFLAPAALLMLLYGHQWIAWYLSRM